ncbi:hypothetical protein [Paenibacillus bouchesdurhonensis]|uniref:hypothetical protein n=1 Tax=Paenibacillus bouchesdurhonensis TaxID=1870990 RepID=UPI000DA633E0|nr:hypothetical protein [Paenibacillus bouchesdurhonensis]
MKRRLLAVQYMVYIGTGGRVTAKTRAMKGQSVVNPFLDWLNGIKRTIPEIPGVRDQHQIVPVVCSCTKQLNPITGIGSYWPTNAILRRLMK